MADPTWQDHFPRECQERQLSWQRHQVAHCDVSFVQFSQSHEKKAFIMSQFIFLAVSRLLLSLTDKMMQAAAYPDYT
jgi:hypothetical protein